ncbi:MAG: hypothetical protein JW904_11035 [Spirochaetales bacterium]|nr:hypothetical protein [Spirochaetales bacterium]
MKSIEDINRFIDELCHHIGNGDFTSAFDLIKLNTIIDPVQVDVLKSQTESQLNMIIGRYGNDLGFEEIKEQLLGAALLKKTVIQKYKIIPLKWEFIFYKADENWRLINVQFNEDYAGLF